MVLRAAWLPIALRSRFSLTTVSDCTPTLYRFARTTRRAQIRSFRRSGTDRPFRPICSLPSADSNRCVRFQLIYPATNTLCCRLVAAPKPVCRGRPYWTLARPQSTCSGWDGCSSQQQSSTADSSFALPPAGFLQTDVRVHHTVTQDLPQSGHSHRALTTTSSYAQSQAREY